MEDPDRVRALAEFGVALLLFAIGLELPGGIAQVRHVVLETARAFHLPDAYVRLIVTRGEGALGVDPATCPEPRGICIVDRVRLYPPEKLARGIDLVSNSLKFIERANSLGIIMFCDQATGMTRGTKEIDIYNTLAESCHLTPRLRDSLSYGIQE